MATNFQTAVTRPLTRRTLVQGLAALTASACTGMAIDPMGAGGGGEGGGVGTGGGTAGGAAGGAGGGAETPDAGVNRPPVWATIPTITFTQGVAGTFSIAQYVSDADGDSLTLMKNAVALPAGVTFDAAGKQFVYDGGGAIASSTGHVLTADDGK